MKQHDLITALRARGRSDALAQAAADEIERLQGIKDGFESGVLERAKCKLVVEPVRVVDMTTPKPDGFIITESGKDFADTVERAVVLMGDEAEALAQITNKARASIAASRAAAKKAPAKTAKRK